MTTTPAVSVLLSAYRHEAYVEQALDSVADQSFRDFELIITDDCSPDGTVERISCWLAGTGYPARFIRNHRNLGICKVRNQALSFARGRYVCSLAADDWYEPDRLARQCEFFASLPADVGFVYSDVSVCWPDGTVSDETLLGRLFGAEVSPPEGDLFELLLQGNFVPAPGVMIRRAALDAVGGFDESLDYEDYDMWLRLARRYLVRYLPGVVANYRELRTGMVRSPEWRPAMRRSTVQLLSRWLGIEPAHDVVLARTIRAECISLASSDRPAARETLRLLRAIPPRRRWRIVEIALALPGFAPVLRFFAQPSWRRVSRRP